MYSVHTVTVDFASLISDIKLHQRANSLAQCLEHFICTVPIQAGFDSQPGLGNVYTTAVHYYDYIYILCFVS